MRSDDPREGYAAVERPKHPPPPPEPDTPRVGRTISGTVPTIRREDLRDELTALRARHENLLRATACAAHELRGRLHTAAGWLQVLADEQPTDHRALPRIERALASQARLLDDLVDALRFESGYRLSMNVERTSLDAIVRASVENVALPAARKSILLAMSPMRPIVVVGDPHRLDQAITNVLSNAVKFTEPGGSVAIDLDEVGEDAVLSVSDTGCGIASEHLETIFAMFSRLDERVEGVGVGLGVARQIVMQHGGALELESTPGVGTTVRIRIPRAGASQRTPA